MSAVVLNWVWTASLLILAVLLLRAAFGRRISARLRYALWAAVLVRLLVPGQLYTAPAEVPRVFPEPPALQALPLTQGAPAKETGTVPGGEGGQPVQVLPGPAGEESASAVPEGRSPGDLAALLGGIWLAGSAAAAAAFLISNGSFARRLRRLRVPLEAECPLPVYRLEGLPSPCLFGVFRPAVYVTPEAAADPVTLRHVLAHETAHYRQGDHIWTLLRCGAAAVHWWNPLVWLAAVLSRRDAELACDERALKRLGDGERRAYGNTLLALVTAGPRPGDLLRCATTMTGSKRSLRERVSRIARTPKRWLWAAALSALLAALVCACSFAKTAETGPETEDGPLTAEELERFNNEVFNGEGFNMMNQFLFQAVEAPKDYKHIDLYQLFYNGIGTFSCTEEERQAVANAAWGGEDPGIDLLKCSAGEMDKVLREYLGLSLEETDKRGLDRFTYLEEYDAYYTFHGDTNYPGDVTFTFGERRDGAVLLYYEGSGFPGLSSGNGEMTAVTDGPACVTLEERRDGGYRFLTNWRYDPPAVPTAYPAWDPERVISLDGLEPYKSWKDMEPDTVPADTMGEVLCAETLGDGTEVVCYWEPDHLTNPDHAYTKYWAIRRGDRLLRFCQEDSGYTDGYTAGAFEQVLGREGFWIACPRGAAYQARDYYVLDEGGVPRPLADCANEVTELDLDGNGEKELAWTYHGGGETYLYFRRDGALYLADIRALVSEAWPEAKYVSFGFWDPASRALSFSAEVPLSGTDRTVTAFRTMWFDGENLRLYKDESGYTDHMANGLEALPADVLAAARDFAEERFNALAAEGFGADGSGSYDEENFGPGNVVWDDWRVTGLSGPWYETAGDLRVEVWSVSYETHTATPDRVILAGGSYMGEDGWCMIGYPGRDYLYFRWDGEGSRTYLFSKMENDCAPGAELFQEDLVSALTEQGLLDPAAALAGN